MQGVEIPETTSVPTTNGEAPPAPRNGARGMVPSTWLGRSVRIGYIGVSGEGVETSGVLLDWCPFGLLISLAGAKALLSWDRLVMLELVSD